jgi:hypothetical protein
MRHQRIFRFGRQRQRALGLFGLAREEMPSQRKDVFAALAQWGELNRNYAQAEKKILAKATRRNLLSDWPIGRGHDSDIDLPRLGATDPQHLVLRRERNRDAVRAHPTDWILTNATF